jgi:dipeptidyl aminopeptidase/acylaminoacyl peptidase
MARTGERLPTAAPWVIDILSRKLVRIDVPVDDRILLLIGWSTDGSAVCFVQFSRDMSWAGVYRADASTGAAQLLFEEKVDTFLRIQHEVVGGRSGCTLLPDGGFLWESARDGWDHLHHYDAKGHHVRQVTSGEWPVIDVQAIDAKAGVIYFSAHHDPRRPYDVHVCRVPLKGGSVERLTGEPGSHDVQFSPDRSVFIDTVSRPDSPPQSVVRRAAGGEILHRFAPADISALQQIGWTPPEQATVKAADGKTDLWAVIYKPRDFDPSRSYPVIEHIYGGPQVTWAQHFFATPPYTMGMLNQALPQLGYVVVVLDARGTPERSRAFQDAVYKEWRRHVTADHAAAIRNLAKDRPWMDLKRVGMWGHSWGGYYTFANLIDNPDLYRAGLCSAPGFDPYDAFIYEPYLGGVPAAHNRAAYEDAHLVTDAGKLQSELMIVAGTNDMSVWQGSVRMADALIRAGKQHEFVLMPNQHHLYGGAHDSYFIEKMIGFFERTLRNAGETRP